MTELYSSGAAQAQGGGFLHKLKVLENANIELQSSVDTLQLKLQEQDSESQREQKRLLHDTERVFINMLELLDNRTHSIGHLHSKCAGLIKTAADANDKDISEKLQKADKAIVELQEKCKEKVKLIQEQKNAAVKAKDRIPVPDATPEEDLKGEKLDSGRTLDPAEMQSEIDVLHQLRDTVTVLERQLQEKSPSTPTSTPSKNSKKRNGQQTSSIQKVTQLNEQLVIREKEKAKAEQALQEYRDQVQAQAAFVTIEKKRLRDENNMIYHCMQQVLSLQQKQTADMQSDLSSLETLVDHERPGHREMQSRLQKLQESLQELVDRHDEKKAATEAEHDRFLSELSAFSDLETSNSSSVTSNIPDVTEDFAQLSQMKQGMAFLSAQIQAVDKDDKDAKNAAGKAGADKADQVQEMRTLILEEKEGSIACLLDVTLSQEKELQLIRSHFDLFKNKNVDDSGVEEMETRLDMAAAALENVRGECTASLEKLDTGNDDDLLKPSNIQANFSTLKQLRGVANFIQAQLQAVSQEEEMDDRIYPVKPPQVPTTRDLDFGATLEQQGVAGSKKLDDSIYDENSPFKELKELLGMQYDETVRLTSRVASLEKEKNNVPLAILRFVFRSIFYGTILLLVLYLVRIWDGSMTTKTFNILCAPAMPGSRITGESGVLSAPFWAPVNYKDNFYQYFCEDIPRIQMEIKQQSLVLTELHPLPVPGVVQYTRKQYKKLKDLFSDKSANKEEKQVKPRKKEISKEDSHIQRYPAKSAYVSLDGIFTLDSDGWHKEIALPWGSRLAGGEAHHHDHIRYPRSRRHQHGHHEHNHY